MNCQRCGARSQAALCRTHESDLRRMLQELAGTVNPQTGRSTAGWIEHLADAAVGTVRMGGDGGRKTRGDDAPIRFNDKASQLLQQVQGSLGMWVRDICESRGIEYEPVRFERPGFIGPLQLGVLRGLHYMGGGAPLALWLEVHVGAVLASEDAGMFLQEIEGLIGAITRLIDSPIPNRDIGPCPTIKGDDGRQRCDTWLSVKRIDPATGRPPIEVTCPGCHLTQNIDRLMQDFLHRANHMQWTHERILQIMDIAQIKVPERTMRRWRHNLPVKPCGYLRADGRRIGITRASVDDVPLYRLADVQKKIAELPTVTSGRMG